jgi:creatinine amidohydrolase
VGAALLAALPALGQAQVLHVAELNTEQIRRLDRAKTAVLLVGGILEQHGPYLPSYTDGYASERLARELAEGIAARPGWTALMFPTLPLGHGGANVIGLKLSFPGSYNVRASTLRAVYMDLADALGEQGFRWVFVVDVHGSPRHNAALEDAGDYFHDAHGGRMVHLFGLQAMRECCGEPKRRLLGEAGMKEDGFTVHAGAREHATVLFVRPDLVSPAVTAAPAVTGSSFADLMRLAGAPDWSGYFGSPRLASAALGAQTLALYRDELLSLALRVLDGWDPTAERRYATLMAADPAHSELQRGLDAEERRREDRQRAWLEKRRP